MNPRDLRAEIPALAHTTYFNTGASGPSPRSVIRAATECVEHLEVEAPAGEGVYEAADSVFDGARRSVANHLGTATESIALTQSTVDGIGKAGLAIDWTPGDVVVLTDTEHPANVLPWRRLARKYDLEIRTVYTDDGFVDRDRFADAVREARMVCLSSVCWMTGVRRRVAELVDIAREGDAITLVDAVQSVGQRAIDVDRWGADIVVASGHKWLLGLWGGGFLYLDSEMARTVHPGQIGYFGAEATDDGGYTLEPGAKRFELGTASPVPYAALAEAIRTMETVGLDAVTARIRALTDRLKAGIEDERLLSPGSFESGLVSIRVDDADRTVERLESVDIRIRAIPRDETIRVSVHAFNTEAEIDRLLDQLRGDRPSGPQE